MARLTRLVRRLSAENVLTAVVVAGAVAFVLLQLQPRLLLADTIPSGGDMGAHVWGPAYLRDHLLTQGRLTGWSPDWYAGFPAFHFYMVLPSLLIVALDVVLPYGIAFKLVSVAGLLTLPVAAWALGRLARFPFPGPPLLAVAAVAFIFDRSFTIYGGNAASTLAGEFAFSISLSLVLVYFGILARGLQTGRHRALAAGVFALAVLCHVIPALFAAAGTVVWLAVHFGRARLKYVVSVGAVGAALTGFWALPFLWRRGYMTDMGYEKLTTYWEALLPGSLGKSISRAFGGQATTTIVGDLTWVAVLAVLGAAMSIIFRRRLGIVLALIATLAAVAFVLLPEGRLWNARLLPFWYLCLYLLAAVAVAEFVISAASLVSRRAEAPARPALLGLSAAAALVTLTVVGMPLRTLPFGSTAADGSYHWMGLTTTDQSFVPSWARWNYSGYERKEAYPEFHALLSTMGQVGTDNGCGRAMWEYEADLDRFGTPMALMLLPFATDGCIGSMEGLYFESSGTTPYHFLNSSELSAAPSNPQRDLPYATLDVANGVDHLQLLGVRYYMAFSPEAVRQAGAEPDLTLVATSGTWKIYEVADSALVEPLDAEPVVLADVPDKGEGWQDAAVEWYMDPSAHDVFVAASGPPSWASVEQGEEPEARPVAPAVVDDIETGTDTISFTVDRPGTPVLVKASYFPSWEVSGADGPYRVAPNLMVVVPTDTEVELRYVAKPLDWLAWALTGLGVVGLVLLARSGPVTMPERRRRRDDGGKAEIDRSAETDPWRIAVPSEGEVETERQPVSWARSSAGPVPQDPVEVHQAEEGAGRASDDGGPRRSVLLDVDPHLDQP